MLTLVDAAHLQQCREMLIQHYALSSHAAAQIVDYLAAAKAMLQHLPHAIVSGAGTFL